MPSIACSRCQREFDDELLCCPHCGTAQIPQLSKAELRLLNIKESRGALGVIYGGMAAGALIGAAYFVFTLVQGTASFQDGAIGLLCGMLGSAAGFFYYYAFRKNQR
jgi:hypothetical protein